jgi:DNA-binding XRE family transcriptional regulator
MAKNRHIHPMTWQDHEDDMLAKGLITQEEIDASKARVAIMCELIDARNEKKISQRRLEELTGVRQATISDMEAGKSSPSVDTMLKVLAPLGKTLAVVPIEQRR